MFRAFILPVILMSMVGGPVLYSHHQRHSNVSSSAQTELPANPWQPASHQAMLNTPVQPALAQVSTPVQYPTGFPQRPTFPAVETSVLPLTAQPVSFPVAGNPANIAAPTVATSQRVAAPVAAATDMSWAQPGMTPDFAKTETLVFPGDANGPDLSAAPMSFTPTIDLASLFRFDISKQWVTSRWNRVSTCPSHDGLHGMRVALVTGTNSWDLHGSLTYYFDPNHRVQRITYRGWTGDANRLLNTLQQHQLKPQPTHWAGVYLSKRSGLLMKYPAVIDKSNTVQQLALILELNNPSGKTPMSNDFQSLLPAAIVSR